MLTCCCYQWCLFCHHRLQQERLKSSLTPSSLQETVVTIFSSESTGTVVTTITKAISSLSCLHSSREAGDTIGTPRRAPATRAVAMAISDDTDGDGNDDDDDGELTATPKVASKITRIVSATAAVLVVVVGHPTHSWLSPCPLSLVLVASGLRSSLVLLLSVSDLLRLLRSDSAPCPDEIRFLTPAPRCHWHCCDKTGKERKASLIGWAHDSSGNWVGQTCTPEFKQSHCWSDDNSECRVVQTKRQPPGDANYRKVSFQSRREPVARSSVTKNTNNSLLVLNSFTSQLWVFIFVLLGQTLLTLTPLCFSAPTNLNQNSNQTRQEVNFLSAEISEPGYSGKTIEELRHDTPDYIFKLHHRHENEWQDFGQFDPDHIRHPGHLEREAKKRTSQTSGGSSDLMELSEGEKSLVFQSIYGNSGRLGTVTAVRHHRHVATHDVEPLGRSRRSAPDPQGEQDRTASEVQEHRMIFRLADMPKNEELLAVSLRLRYAPRQANGVLQQSFVQTMSTHCRRFTTDQPHWPISVWMHYEDPDLGVNRSSAVDVQAMATFEPDRPVCRLMRKSANSTLLHLPPGWFNIPLNPSVIRLLKQVEGADNKARRYISIRIRIATHLPETGYSSHQLGNVLLQEWKGTAASNRPVFHREWLHEAPHLFTFHRDPELVTYLSRQKRSLALKEKNNLSMPSNSEAGRQTPINVKVNYLQQPGHSAYAPPATRSPNEPLRPQQQQQQKRVLSRHHPAAPRRKRRAAVEAKGWRKNTRPNGAYSSSQYYQPQQQQQSGYSGMPAQGRHQQVNRPGEGINTDHYQASMESRGLPNGLDIAYLETTCQRRDLLIDFDAVGWGGWVIAPQVYNARYCHGQCPFPLSTHYNTTNHAVLLQLVHLLDAASIAGPCCVPDSLSSQSLLYHSQNGDVVLRVYQDMVVESCACR